MRARLLFLYFKTNFVNLKEAKAPAKITLPKELVFGMQDAWDKSFPKGKSQEQGGILVRHKDASYEWKAGKEL